MSAPGSGNDTAVLVDVNTVQPLDFQADLEKHFPELAAFLRTHPDWHPDVLPD